MIITPIVALVAGLAILTFVLIFRRNPRIWIEDRVIRYPLSPINVLERSSTLVEHRLHGDPAVTLLFSVDEITTCLVDTITWTDRLSEFIRGASPTVSINEVDRRQEINDLIASAYPNVPLVYDGFSVNDDKTTIEIKLLCGADYRSFTLDSRRPAADKSVAFVLGIRPGKYLPGDLPDEYEPFDLLAIIPSYDTGRELVVTKSDLGEIPEIIFCAVLVSELLQSGRSEISPRQVDTKPTISYYRRLECLKY